MITLKELWQNWSQGWAISRQYNAPEQIENGYRFTVYDGKREFEWQLFSPDTLPEVLPLVSNRDYLCVSGVTDDFTPPDGWQHKLFAFMMSNPNLQAQAVVLPEHSTLEQDISSSRVLMKVRDEQGEIVCSGQVGYYADFVIFDRIETALNYRHQGYATAIMNLLTQNALERGIYKGLLSASEQGRYVYQRLGWQILDQSSRLLRADYQPQSNGEVKNR